MIVTPRDKLRKKEELMYHMSNVPDATTESVFLLFSSPPPQGDGTMVAAPPTGRGRRTQSTYCSDISDSRSGVYK